MMEIGNRDKGRSEYRQLSDASILSIQSLTKRTTFIDDPLIQLRGDKSLLELFLATARCLDGTAHTMLTQ
jgi:hypothetical protein